MFLYRFFGLRFIPHACQISSNAWSSNRYNSFGIFTRSFSFVGFDFSLSGTRCRLLFYITRNLLGFFHLSRIRCNFTAIIHVTKDRGSRNDYDPLPFRFRCLSCFIHSELDLSILCRRFNRSNFHFGRIGSNRSLSWLFLHLLYESDERRKVWIACVRLIATLLMFTTIVEKITDIFDRYHFDNQVPFFWFQNIFLLVYSRSRINFIHPHCLFVILQNTFGISQTRKKVHTSKLICQRHLRGRYSDVHTTWSM